MIFESLFCLLLRKKSILWASMPFVDVEREETRFVSICHRSSHSELIIYCSSKQRAKTLNRMKKGNNMYRDPFSPPIVCSEFTCCTHNRLAVDRNLLFLLWEDRNSRKKFPFIMFMLVIIGWFLRFRLRTRSSSQASSTKLSVRIYCKISSFL